MKVILFLYNGFGLNWMLNLSSLFVELVIKDFISYCLKYKVLLVF